MYTILHTSPQEKNMFCHYFIWLLTWHLIHRMLFSSVSLNNVYINGIFSQLLLAIFIIFCYLYTTGCLQKKITLLNTLLWCQFKDLTKTFKYTTENENTVIGVCLTHTTSVNCKLMYATVTMTIRQLTMVEKIQSHGLRYWCHSVAEHHELSNCWG